MHSKDSIPRRVTPYGNLMICIQICLVMVFIAGVIMFPVGYNTAFVKYSLPAFPTWRTNEGIVEDTKFDGVCAAKLWYVVYHTSEGFLQQPKRITAWHNWNDITSESACTAMRTQKKNIMYDTRTPTTLTRQSLFESRKIQYEEEHNSGTKLFWAGVTCISLILGILTVILAWLVMKGLHYNYSKSMEQAQLADSQI